MSRSRAARRDGRRRDSRSDRRDARSFTPAFPVASRYSVELHAWRDGLDARRDGVNGVGTAARKSVVVVGTGTLGATVALLLAQAGVPRIDALDPETLDSSNGSRHPCDIQDLGRNKGRDGGHAASPWRRARSDGGGRVHAQRVRSRQVDPWNQPRHLADRHPQASSAFTSRVSAPTPRPSYRRLCTERASPVRPSSCGLEPVRAGTARPDSAPGIVAG